MKQYLVLISFFISLAGPCFGASGAGQPIHKANENLYTMQMSRDLYLNMEKVTDSNIEFWRGYAKEREITVPSISAQMIKEIQDAKGVMEQVIQLYGPDKEKHPQLWICYASYIPGERITKEGFSESMTLDMIADLFSHIEMAVSITTMPKVPFQVHMGIARNLFAYLKEKPKHKHLSIMLHTFAAKVMEQVEPKTKIYVITAPVREMQRILLKNLPHGSVTLTESKSWSTADTIRTYGCPPTPLALKNDDASDGYLNKLSLKDPEGSIIFHLEYKKPSDLPSFSWLFHCLNMEMICPIMTINFKTLNDSPISSAG